MAALNRRSESFAGYTDSQQPGRIDEPVVLRLGAFGQVRDVVDRVVTADREHGQEKPSPASG